MELDKIKELIDMMKANDLNELEIVDGQTRVVLKRGAGQSAPQVVAITPAPAANGLAAANQQQIAPADNNAASAPADADPQQGMAEITAPMVGTFYAAPSPSAEPFVQAGSAVEEDTVICVIEAMKVMNEVKSGVKGVVKEILVDNGSAVEFGQQLFLVEPA